MCLEVLSKLNSTEVSQYLYTNVMHLLKMTKWFCNIHRKTAVLESRFNKVAGLKACNFIKKGIQHRCFPVNDTKFLRKPFLRNICEWLLLKF